MTFADLQLIEPILRAVQQEGYTDPTPIQAQAIPHVLAGRDLIACAQTGTGKTAAFALPLIQHLAFRSSNGAAPDRQGKGIDNRRKRVRVLVLSPTRELASQIADSFNVYGKHTGLKTTVIYGGVGQNPQVQSIRNGTDILVATPGRLLDLMGQGYVKLDSVERFVLDEADRMLDMGFIHDVRRIISALPKQRQTLFFSATMPGEIQSLADDILTDPVRVEVTPSATTVEKITQAVYFVAKRNKRALLEHLLNDKSISRALIFTRTKHGANKLAEQLEESNIMAEAIHGNKSQTAREKALFNFKRGMTRVLVATDIAARGIDVDDVSHVINFDLPYEPDSYVHRIGRTARAGASGIAFSFCDEEEFKLLRDIERLIRMDVPVAQDYPFSIPKSAYDAAISGGSGGAARRGYANRGSGHAGGSRSNSYGGQRSSSGSGSGRSGGSSSGRSSSSSSSGRTDSRSSSFTTSSSTTSSDRPARDNTRSSYNGGSSNGGSSSYSGNGAASNGRSVPRPGEGQVQSQSASVPREVEGTGEASSASKRRRRRRRGGAPNTEPVVS